MPDKSKILVLTEAYPSKDKIYAMRFVHTRLKEYLKKGFDVTVLSFSADVSYNFENVNVIPPSSFDRQKKYALIISHAPNIRNHIKFLLLYGKCAKQIIFIIHGHEVLKTKNYYPKPYEFAQGKLYLVKSLLQNVYDIIKCNVLCFYINKNISSRVKVLFVSKWMRDAFLENINVDKVDLDSNSQIIPNCIGQKFIEENYSSDKEKIADFITIRPFDNSKYAIDIVIRIATANPNNSFHIYGEGKYFDYNASPENVKIFNHYIQNDDIPDILNNYSAALMPTRLDAQGVSMCEMANFGIPMVVSDIPICREMMTGFGNVAFVDNENPTLNAKNFLENVNLDAAVNKQKFSLENTVFKEIEYIKFLIQ